MRTSICWCTAQAATASLAAVTEEVEKRLHSPTKHHPNHHVHIHLGDSVGGLGAGAAAGGASEATHGRGHRVSAGSQQVHAGPAGGPQQQVSVRKAGRGFTTGAS